MRAVLRGVIASIALLGGGSQRTSSGSHYCAAHQVRQELPTNQRGADNASNQPSQRFSALDGIIHAA
jgi:hypothetical protein